MTTIPLVPLGDPSAQAGLEAEALIREAQARKRRRRRRQFVLILAAVIVAACSYGAVSLFGPSSGTNSGTTGFVRAGVFASTWRVHTTELTINSDGRGVVQWPIHVTCGTGPGMGPPPCDRLVPATIAGPQGNVLHVNEIIDGGHADVLLTSVNSKFAEGRIEHSTVQSTLPDGPATFRVSKADLLYMTVSRPTTGSPFGRSPLCGPKAAALTPAQQEAEGINCGA